MKILLPLIKKTGFVFLWTLLFAFTQKGFGQSTFTSTWSGTSNTSAVTTGAGASFVTANAATGIGISNFSSGSNGIQAKGWPTNGITSSNYSYYYQYTISPSSASLSISSLTFSYKTSGNGQYNSSNNWDALVIYSLDNFGNSNEYNNNILGSNPFTPNTSSQNFSNPLGGSPITVPNGQTLTIRVYAGYSNNSNYYFYCNNLVLSGTATSIQSITTSTSVSTPLCVTSTTTASVSVPFTSAGTFTSNTYTAQLSNASGSFSSPTNIGTLTSNSNSGTISATIPAATAGGSGYLIRVISSSPAVTGSSSNAVTIYSPSNSIAATTVQNINTSTNGTALTVTEAATPTSRQWYYGATAAGPYSNSISGATGTSYTPNFSAAGTYYVVCVSTFACGTATSNAVQVNVVAATITTGAISGSPFCVTPSSGVSVNVPFTSTGYYSSNTYTAQLSNASGSFSSPTNIGTLTSNANSGTTINATIPAATATGSGYLIRVVSSSPSITGSSSGALVINYASNSVSPTGPQSITAGVNGTVLTVSEASTATSRQWYYGTVSGTYNNAITGATGTSYTPNFTVAGTYYVVCKSVFSCATITSNAVQVTVNPGPLYSLSITTPSSAQPVDSSFTQTITITGKDQYGNLTSGTNGVNITTTAGTITPSTVTLSSGTASATFKVTVSGSSQTITATSQASSSITATTSGFVVNQFYSSTSGDYYRTNSSGGDWATASTWQGSHDNIYWYTATRQPTNTANSIIVQSGHSITVSTAVTTSNLAINGVINVNGANGNLSNSGTITGASTTKLVIGAGGTYTHAVDGGTIPTASWNTSSTCVVSGANNTAPSGLGQGFGNFTWTSNLSNDILDLNGALTTINGNFTFAPSNSNYSLRLATSGSYTLNIGGSFIIPSYADGTIRLSDGSSNPLVNVGGNISITSSNSDLDFGNGNGYGTINVTGSVSISGSANLETSVSNTNGIINFKGTNQSLSASSADINSVNFNINNGSVVTLSAGLTLSSNSVFTVLSGGTLIFGNNAITDDDFSCSFTTLSGSTLQIGSNYGIVQNTEQRNYYNPYFYYNYYSPGNGNIVLKNYTFAAGANYIYNGTSAQVTGNALPATLSGNLTISNTNASTGVTLSNTAQTINGTLNVAAGSILTMPSATSTTTFAGVINTNNTGVINAGTTSTLSVTGTISTPIVFGTASFASLTLNHAGSVLVLGSALNTASLNLTSGKIDASAYGLTVTGSPTIAGASATNYVITGNGSGNGFLQINNLSVGTAYSFPIGTSSYYLPATVNPATGFGSLNWAVKVYPFVTSDGSYNPSQAYSGAALASIVNAEWDITPKTSGNIYQSATTASITLNWQSQLEGSVFSTYTDSYIGISHYTSGAWQGGKVNGGASNTTNYVTATFTSFSPFGIGSINNPLPVILVDFNAELNSNKTVDVSWTTQQEVNSSHFEIERSADGISWETIGSVEAKGNSALPSDYTFNDPSPLMGTNYYRLKMVNINDAFGFTTVKVVRTLMVKGINIFPNPARSYVNVSVSQAATDLNIRLISQSGQVMQAAKINAGTSTTLTLQVSNYPQGTYILQISAADGTTQTSKIVIMR